MYTSGMHDMYTAYQPTSRYFIAIMVRPVKPCGWTWRHVIVAGYGMCNILGTFGMIMAYTYHQHIGKRTPGDA